MIIPLLLILIVLVTLILDFKRTSPKQTEKHNTMSVSVRTCTCNHASQEKMYGPKQRLHNKCAKGHRCTVCGNVKSSGDSTPKK
jgi:hypothetical protein